MARNLITRIAHAEHSSDLSEHKDDVQVLRAAGLAAISEWLGQLLTRYLHSHRDRDKSACVSGLAAVMRKKYGQLDERQCAIVASWAIDYWAYPACRPCKGRGYDVIPETPTLSDHPCAVCHGSGKRAWDPPPKVSRAAQWATREIDVALDRYASKTSRKLGR